MCKNVILLIMAALVAGRAVAQTTEPIGKVLESDRYKYGTVAAMVVDPDKGELFSMNADRRVAPASCLKLIVTASAMHYLGPDHRFETVLQLAGTTDTHGRLGASLVIRGGGDPTLGSTRVKSSTSSDTLIRNWVKVVKDAGITDLKGGVVSDSSFFGENLMPPGWTWDDIGNYYGAAPAGLAFNDNLYWLYFSPGPKPGARTAIASVEPGLPGNVTFDNEVMTGKPGSGDNAYIFGAPGQKTRYVTGTVPQGPIFGIKGSLPSPGLALAQALSDRLSSEGVRIGKAPREMSNPAGEITTLSVVQSPSLFDIEMVLNKQSFNLYAETLALQVGRARGNGNALDDGLAAEREYLRSLGVDVEALDLTDGSGLSRSNCVTARAMTQLLRGVQKEKWFEPWLSTLPVGGKDGDLAERAAAAPPKGSVKAKTGLIGGVRGLCGYLDTKSGRRLIFALIANDYKGGYGAVDKDFDALLRHFYDNN